MPLPKQLEDLHMTCNINHPREALALAVHVLMTEVGFELEGWQETLPDGSTRDHPATENFFWDRSDCLMKIGYSHPTCPAVSFLVAFVLFDPSVIIHGLVAFENNTEGFSLNLRISDFIQKAFLSDPEPNKVYKNLPTLSRVVKDSVALPLLGWAQSVKNVAPTFGFMTLSSEIQLLILGYLNVRDLLAASRVNTDLFELASHPVLWRKLFLKNFPSVEVSPTDNVSDWRERYKREYLLRKEQQEHALRILPRMQVRLVMPNPLRNTHRPFLLPPVPQISDDDFDFDMFMQCATLPLEVHHAAKYGRKKKKGDCACHVDVTRSLSSGMGESWERTALADAGLGKGGERLCWYSRSLPGSMVTGQSISYVSSNKELI
ncbi:F-box only protein 7-like isoform X2 [Dermacentor variabilis]|uniref:F-box only protein 7-like isoform X2 n=1 Tax=Dermacentor variabilis TaxID=34621 RepID=UPI003F5B289B